MGAHKVFVHAVTCVRLVGWLSNSLDSHKLVTGVKDSRHFCGYDTYSFHFTRSAVTFLFRPTFRYLDQHITTTIYKGTESPWKQNNF